MSIAAEQVKAKSAFKAQKEVRNIDFLRLKSGIMRLKGGIMRLKCSIDMLRESLDRAKCYTMNATFKLLHSPIWKAVL
jgi:hypothetical protein